MNKVILIGRLTKDPTITYSENGQKRTAIAKYGLAVARKFKREGENDCDFINCTCFGATAEFAEKYLRKGTKIAISGRIQTGSYTNKDGQKVYTTDVIIEEHEFCESKSASSGGNSNGPAQQATDTPKSSDGFMNIPQGIDEDLPFN